MITRAQMAIQTGQQEEVPVCMPFDGCLAHLQPALARWKPQHILAARDPAGQGRGTEPLGPAPRAPRILPCPTREFACVFMGTGCQWVAVISPSPLS